MFVIDDILLGIPFLVWCWQAVHEAQRTRTGVASMSDGQPDVQACRSAVPVEPGLQHTSALLGGYFYTGHDPAHLAYLNDYLDSAANAASGETKRSILAFKALQAREGSTAAINTYDNQIITLGTGWGGLGGLPRVMDTLVHDPTVVQALAACGVSYIGGGQWNVVDDTGTVVTGKKEALQVIRSTPQLLNLFIHIAKDPLTRDAVTQAQLNAFLATSGNVPGSETIATQALYNFVTHLRHWAPGYMAGTVEEAAATVPGAPSAERDAALAPAIVRGFYTRAHGWIPDWKQMQSYVQHMKQDGLDVTGDPTLSASSHPASGTPKVAAGPAMHQEVFVNGQQGVIVGSPVHYPYSTQYPVETADGAFDWYDAHDVKVAGGSGKFYPLWVLLDKDYAVAGVPFDRSNPQHWNLYSRMNQNAGGHMPVPDLFRQHLGGPAVVGWLHDPSNRQRGAFFGNTDNYAFDDLPDITPFGDDFGKVIGKPVDPMDWNAGIGDKTAGGCGILDYPNPEVCGNWGTFASKYLSNDPPPAPVKVVGGPGYGGPHPFVFRSHGFHHPWYQGQAPSHNGYLIEPPYTFAVLVAPDGDLSCAGVVQENVSGTAGHVTGLEGQPLGVAQPHDTGYSLAPPGFEGAYEVTEEPELTGQHTAGGPATEEAAREARAALTAWLKQDPSFHTWANGIGLTQVGLIQGVLPADAVEGEVAIAVGYLPGQRTPFVQQLEGTRFQGFPLIVREAPMAYAQHTAGGPGEGWGEVYDPADPYRSLRRAQGPLEATPEQVAIIRRGILPAVQAGEVDPPTWSQINVQGYDLMVMNEPLVVKGLRLPTNQKELYAISRLLGAVPVTPVIAEARWANAQRKQYQPSGQVTGGKGELINDPGQVVRANAALGPNQGVLTDGGWKELNVHPGLSKSGRGAMAQYGYRNADGSMFEHGGPSNHDEHYKGASDTPTYVSRKALKNGVEVDLLAEYAAGGPLTAALPAWLIAELRGEVGA